MFRHVNWKNDLDLYMHFMHKYVAKSIIVNLAALQHMHCRLLLCSNFPDWQLLPLDALRNWLWCTPPPCVLQPLYSSCHFPAWLMFPQARRAIAGLFFDSGKCYRPIAEKLCTSRRSSIKSISRANIFHFPFAVDGLTRQKRVCPRHHLPPGGTPHGRS
jgi:hypothetical protein